MINYDYIQHIKYIDYNCIKGFQYEKYVCKKITTSTLILMRYIYGKMSQTIY